ncbi:MAG TPA: type II secretion system F family protein [Candidatus Koribacter sp.]|jgi:type IV pilus assembly protein PilC
MAEYLVKLADERGHIQEKTETGHSESEVRDRFAQAGFLVYSVKARGITTPGGFRLRRSVKPQQFLIFNQQFLTLVRAGLPIVQAVELLMRRQRNEYFRRILEDIRDRLKGGALLSEAFEAQQVFPKIYTTTLLAGEKSGNLEEVVGRYIAFQRLLLSFRKKLLASLIYPSILVCAVILLFSLLITWVVPRFAALFKDLGSQLPAITEFVLTFGENAQTWGPWVLLGLVLLGFVFFRWKKTESGSRRWDHFLLALPVFGQIWLKSQVATFSRMLSTLLSGGLPLVPSLETAAASIGSKTLAIGIHEASRSVREGKSLARSLEATASFPDLSVEMIEVGESTGALSQMLVSVAEFYEEDVQNALAAAMALVEPVILIIMGFVVGFILIALYLPIFSIGMNQR